MAAEREEVYLFRDMLKQISEKNKVTAGDMELEPVDALVRFFVKLLSCLKEYFPSETIRKLVISVSDKTDNLVNALKGALNRIGIGEERYVIQLHQQSYMYYALSQKKSCGSMMWRCLSLAGTVCFIRRSILTAEIFRILSASKRSISARI